MLDLLKYCCNGFLLSLVKMQSIIQRPTDGTPSTTGR